MSENVVSLKGNQVLAPFEVNEAAVKAAEQLLEKTLAGEVQGLVLVMAHADGTFTYTDVGPTTFGLVGKVTQVLHYLAQDASNRGV
jgi:hypothetical protein